MRLTLLAAIAAYIVCASTVGYSRQGTDAQLRGQVYDALGNPIAGVTAKLMLQAEQIRSVTSDEHGSFEISGIPVREYLLILESRGFVTRRIRASLGAGKTESIDVCLDVGIHFTHTPSRVSGFVKQRNGLPLVDAVVKVLNPFDQRVVATGRTDSSGRYRLEVYLGGQYVVVMHKPGFKVAAVAIDLLEQKSLDLTISPLRMPNSKR